MNSTKANKLFLFLLCLQALINLIGVLGPELGFDALWYHLTEAKLFLIRKSITPIPGSLLYWSGLPRLGEIIYSLALKIWDERLTKLIHWGFGVFSAYLVYKITSKHFKKTAALSASLLFYTTLLVGWLSTTSYIDLMMTAFLLLALNARHWWGRGISLILASAVKLHAITYSLAITLIPWSLLGILPFVVINQKTFNNPLYPFLENFGLTNEYMFNGFWFWLSRPLRLFFDIDFRVGPIILILFLLSLFRRHLNRRRLTIIFIVFFIWWFGPGTGFGRFALFLLSLLAIQSAQLFNQKKISLIPLALILIHSLIGISGRVYANQKYLPVIFNQQTKADFLAKNLKFHFGDFYDIDGYFAENIKPTDKVLIYNIHNLYYVDFPYDHHTWQNSQSNYTHILVGDNADLPSKHGQLPLIYQNPTTRVKLYLNK